MPIFGYAIARGFFHTKNVDKYILRMALLAVCSQLPFTLLFGQGRDVAIGSWEFWQPTLNMVVPWTLALLLLKWSPLFIAPVVGLLYFLVPMDYSSLVILLPMVIYWFWFRRKDPWLALIGTSGVLGLIALSFQPIQWFSLLAIPLIYLLEPYDGKLKIKRWFFYWFYPVHIALFFGVALFLGYPTLLTPA